MRLFLSSQDFGNYPEELIELVGENTKTAFINNAKDYYSADDRATKSAEKMQAFHQLGFEVHEFDLRNYFGKQKQLDEELKSYGLVWCSGGNAFILRRAMAASGLDEILKRRLAEDSIAYGGSSAGSCVAATDLHGIENGDRPQPEDVPDEYPNKEIIWSGLGFVDFMVVPHLDTDWFGQEADATIKYLKQNHKKYRALKDGQVIVISGEKEEFLK